MERRSRRAERISTSLQNLSVYGETVRLRRLLAAWFGLNWFGPEVGRPIASLYGLIVVLLTAGAGWIAGQRGWLATGSGARGRVESLTLTPETRIRLAQLVLALLSLMAFRSPFVGSIYGYLGTMWLLTLLAAEAPTAMKRAGWLAGFGLVGGGHVADAIASAAADADSAAAAWMVADERDVLVSPSAESRSGRAHDGDRVEARSSRAAAQARPWRRAPTERARLAAVQQAVDPVSELVVEPDGDGNHGRGAHDQDGGDHANLDDFELHARIITDFLSIAGASRQ